MAETIIAQTRRAAGQWQEPAADKLVLDYEGRFLRRKRLVMASGAAVLVDLPETTSLAAGDALETLDGRLIAIAAADEPLLRVTGDLVRLAWHIGNRHTPCQIADDHLLIRDDHVLAAMLRQLGAAVMAVSGPFTPRGGAYAHGRTLRHDHGPSHGHDDGDHHGHVHGHAHG